MTVPRIALSPAGALLTAVCFFLPWGRVSCVCVRRCPSGAELGGVLWVVFAAALAILGVAAACAWRRRMARARRPIAIAALLALAVLAIEQARLARGCDTLIGRVRPEDVGFRVEFGGVGTLAGLLLALVGALPWPRRASPPDRSATR